MKPLAFVMRSCSFSSLASRAPKPLRRCPQRAPRRPRRARSARAGPQGSSAQAAPSGSAKRPQPRQLPAAAAERSQSARQVNPHAQQDPHGQVNPHGQLTPDSNAPAADLPAGTLEVTIVDATDRPLAGVDVRLGILSQKISEGEQRSEKKAKTNAEGRVRFEGLGTTSDLSYRVTVASGEAEYGSSPFNFATRPDSACSSTCTRRRATCRRPSSSEPSCPSSRARTYSSVDLVLHVFNVSRMGWVPKDFVIDLPEGFKAFSAGEAMSDVRFEPVEGRGAALRGTFPPGEERAQFRFQVPKPADSAVSFSTRSFRTASPRHRSWRRQTRR